MNTHHTLHRGMIFPPDVRKVAPVSATTASSAVGTVGRPEWAYANRGR
jgi:hypothetical protein